MGAIYKESEINEINLASKVDRHESQLVRVETILERVATNQDKMSEAISSISNSILKQELLLEKLTSLEADTKEANKRVHSRVDETIEFIRDVKKEMLSLNKETKDKFEILKPVLFFAQYPKLAFLSIAGLVVLTMSDLIQLFMKKLGV